MFRVALRSFLILFVFSSLFFSPHLMAEPSLLEGALELESSDHQPKIREVVGRILNLQVNPIVCPRCMVTCSHEDGVGDDDWATVPKSCASFLNMECEGAGASLTPAFEMEVWLEPKGEEESQKLVLITTHNLYMPLQMNMSTRYLQLNLPNGIASMAEMQFNRRNVEAKFYVARVKELGDVIVGAEMIPLRDINYKNDVYGMKTEGSHKQVERWQISPAGVRRQ